MENKLHWEIWKPTKWRKKTLSQIPEDFGVIVNKTAFFYTNKTPSPPISHIPGVCFSVIEARMSLIDYRR